MSYNPVQPGFKCIPQRIVKKLFESVHPQPLSRALLSTNAEHFNQTGTRPPMQKLFTSALGSEAVEMILSSERSQHFPPLGAFNHFRPFYSTRCQTTPQNVQL